MEITFRPIESEDFEFLWRLHNAVLKEYVAQVWGWNEKWQRESFGKMFNPASGSIIVVEGADAGFLEVFEREAETVLASIRILPEFQNRGIGTQIIRDVIAGAKSKNRSVRLQVLKINPALHLYTRLGFQIFEETETHFRMRFK